MKPMNRNDPRKELQKGIAPRFGFFPHHDAECEFEMPFSLDKDSRGHHRTFWCATHGQWCYERPVKKIECFANGSQITTAFNKGA